MLKIAESIENEDWGKFLGVNAPNRFLVYVVACSPEEEEWRGKASEELLSRKPSYSDLLYVIAFGPNEWREKALKESFITRPGDHATGYADVITTRDVPSRLKERVWQSLAPGDYFAHALAMIIVSSEEEHWRGRAWSRLSGIKIPNVSSELMYVFVNTSRDWQEKVCDEFIKRGVSKEYFHEMLSYTNGPRNDEMYEVFGDRLKIQHAS